MKILLIDDEPAVLKMYTHALTQAGHEVVTASNPTDGLRIAETEAPAVIFLDIILPGTNGLDVLADLKKSTKTQVIPVYILTNLPESTTAEKARQLGAAGYLMKVKMEPNGLTRILETISK